MSQSDDTSANIRHIQCLLEGFFFLFFFRRKKRKKGRYFFSQHWPPPPANPRANWLTRSRVSSRLLAHPKRSPKTLPALPLFDRAVIVWMHSIHRWDLPLLCRPTPGDCAVKKENCRPGPFHVLAEPPLFHLGPVAIFIPPRTKSLPASPPLLPSVAVRLAATT